MRYAAFFLCLLPSLTFAQDVVRIRAGVRDTVTVSAASTVLVTTESDPLFGAKFAQSIGAYDTRTVSATLYAPLAHASATNNPHGVTAAQVGAPRQLTASSDFATATQDLVRWDGSDWVKRTGTAPSAGLGGVFFAGPSGSYFERQFRGHVPAELFGASVTATASANTTAIQAAATYCAASGRTLLFSDSVYVVNPLIFNQLVRLQLGDNTTLRLANDAPLLGGDLYLVRFMVSGSSLIGGWVDFNRAGQNKSAFNLAGGGSVRKYFGVYASGASGAPIERVVIRTRVINAADTGIRLAYVRDAEVYSAVANSGAGFQATNCDRLSIGLSLTGIDNDGWRVFPHAVDFFNCTYITGNGITSTDQRGDDSTAGGTSLSDWVSGLTVVACQNVKLSNFHFTFAADPTQNKTVGISLLNVTDSDFSNFSARRFADTGLELGSVNRCNFSNYTLDGEYATCNNSAVASTGMSLYSHGYYPDFLSRSIRTTTDNSFVGGRHIRCLNLGLSGQTFSRNSFTKVDFNGNYIGANLDYANNDQTFAGAVVQKNQFNTFTDCRFSTNERAGVVFQAGTDTRFVRCEMRNNGQAKTNTGGAYRHAARGVIGSTSTAGFTTSASTATPGAERLRTRLIGLISYDDQTTTSAVASAVASAPRTLTVENPNLYSFGQTIKLVGAGTAGADLTCQVVDMLYNELTLDRDIVTFPAVAGTGTISSSGTTLTGSGTAFNTQLTGRFYITSGGVTRQVISVASATSATLSEAFPVSLSGATFTITRFAAQQVRSQEYGINLADATDVTTYIELPDFSAGNLTSNLSTGATGVFQLQDPAHGHALTTDRGAISFGGLYGYQVRHNDPMIFMSENDAATDAKQWYWWGNAGKLQLRLRNDAGNVFGTGISFDRAGAVPNGISTNQRLLLTPNTGSTALPTVTVNATTPDVSGYSAAITANTAATSIAQLVGGSPGQILIIIIGDANTTIVHETGSTTNGIKLRGGVNITPTANQTLSFVRGATFWHQTN